MPIIHSRYRNLQFGGRTRVKNEKIYENHKEGAFQQDNVSFLSNANTPFLVLYAIILSFDEVDINEER